MFFFSGDPSSRKRVDMQDNKERGRRIDLRLHNSSATKIQKCVRVKKAFEMARSEVHFFSTLAEHCQRLDRNHFSADSDFLSQLFFIFFTAIKDNDAFILSQISNSLLQYFKNGGLGKSTSASSSLVTESSASMARKKKRIKLLDGEAKQLVDCLPTRSFGRWCTYEWFYGAADQRFMSNEFLNFLNFAKLSRLSRLTRSEWSMIRSSLGNPCHFSDYFLVVEEEKFEDYCEDVSKYYADLSDNPACIEVWKLVFIQFKRESDSTLRPLPAKQVDTGMGFERLTSFIQNKMSNYDADMFMPLFKAIHEHVGDEIKPYSANLGSNDVRKVDTAYRVVADLIRTLCFAITDGSQPGNVGRKYVLRLILRRAVHFGCQKLRAKEGFLSKLVNDFVQVMGGVFPELKDNEKKIKDIIQDEEKSFGNTLVKGFERFKKAADAVREIGGAVLSGQVMAGDFRLAVDMEGFNVSMEEARTKARNARYKAWGKSIVLDANATSQLSNQGLASTNDSPKFQHKEHSSVVMAIYTGSDFIASASGDEDFGLVLKSTSFYAEQGGQELLGDHIDQKGSIVLLEKLRFDFCHGKPVKTEDLEKIELKVNQQIKDELVVSEQEIKLADAKRITGLRAVFGEIYPDPVRVVSIDPVRVVSIGRKVEDVLADPESKEWLSISTELCGGTHVSNTRDAVAFAIISEEGIAKGVWRITTVTAECASQAMKLASSIDADVIEASKLDGVALENKIGSIKSRLDAAAIPATRKANLRRKVSELEGFEIFKKAPDAVRESGGAVLSGQGNMSHQKNLPMFSENKEIVKVVIEFQNSCFEFDLNRNSVISSEMSRALRSKGITEADCYYYCQLEYFSGHEVIKNTSIETGSIVHVNVRMRGGSHSKNIKSWHVHIALYIELLKSKSELKWFEKVTVPWNLWWAGPNSQIALATDSAMTLKLILDCLERSHVTGYCFNGTFSIDDLYYNSKLKVIEIVSRNVISSEISPLGLSNDYQRIKEVVDRYFRYMFAGTLTYPMLVEAFLSEIKQILAKPELCSNSISRAALTRPLCTMTAAQRINVYTAVVMFAKSDANFKAILVAEQSVWTPDFLNSTMRVPLEFLDRYNFRLRNGKLKSYVDDLFSHTDYARCFVSHVELPGKILDAALYMKWDGLLVLIQHAIIKALTDGKPAPEELPKVPTEAANDANLYASIPGSAAIDLEEVIGLK